MPCLRLGASFGGICSRGFLLAVFVATPAAVPAQAQQANTLTQSIGVTLTEEGLVGATWALVMPEGTTVGAAGLKDITSHVPLAPNDRMQVGSVAKTFIATGVLRLVTEDRVDLDAPLAQYLPVVADGLRSLAAGSHRPGHFRCAPGYRLLQWCAVLAAWGMLPFMLWR